MIGIYWRTLTFKKSVIYLTKVNYTAYNYTQCNSTRTCLIMNIESILALHLFPLFTYRSMQGVPNLLHHGSENEDMKRVPNITLNYSDDGDSNEAHMGLPVETTYDENSQDGNSEHQEIPGKHNVKHHRPEHLPVAPLPLPEHHQADIGNQGVARHHYDN